MRATCIFNLIFLNSIILTVFSKVKVVPALN
jgi:hypothetical protein